MHVAELWRYPVKSMAGERLLEAEVRADGIVGDRVVQVRDSRGRVVTSRTRPRLLGHKGTLGLDGEPLVDGRPWTEASVADDVRSAAGETAFLTRDDSPERFDMLPLLVATDGAIAAFGHDGRRLRPRAVQRRQRRAPHPGGRGVDNKGDVSRRGRPSRRSPCARARRGRRVAGPVFRAARSHPSSG